jgi:hypothetical protein
MKHIANKEIAYGTEINVTKTSFLSLSLSLCPSRESKRLLAETEGL